MIGWFIWKARNDHVFNHSPIDPRDILQKITDAWLELQNQATAKASIPAILRDSEGRLLDGQVSSLLSSSTQQVEAQAVRLACFLAKNHNLPSVEIESDNQTIVKLCVSETVPPWESMAVVFDIH
ncbi:hypothetical protein ACSBR1_039160 [Camellia fascicularis]